MYMYNPDINHIQLVNVTIVHMHMVALYPTIMMEWLDFSV